MSKWVSRIIGIVFIIGLIGVFSFIYNKYYFNDFAKAHRLTGKTSFSLFWHRNEPSDNLNLTHSCMVLNIHIHRHIFPLDIYSQSSSLLFSCLSDFIR